jgi:hypothetical protein
MCRDWLLASSQSWGRTTAGAGGRLNYETISSPKIFFSHFLKVVPGIELIYQVAKMYNIAFPFLTLINYYIALKPSVP